MILLDHEGYTIHIEVATEAGMVEILCDYHFLGKHLTLDGVHIQGLYPSALGRAGLNDLAREIMEQADVDSLEISRQSERRVEIGADLRSQSELNVELVLKRCDAISRPVDVAKLLKTFGLGLSDAHKVLDRIVADETVHLRLGGAERSDMITRFHELGVAVE